MPKQQQLEIVSSTVLKEKQLLVPPIGVDQHVILQYRLEHFWPTSNPKASIRM